MQIKAFIFAALFFALCHAQDSIAPPPVVDHRGVLSVQTSVPAGVWMVGQPFGSTPFSVGLSAGWQVYSVRAPGYWTESFIVEIKPGVTILNEVNLKQINLPILEMPDISKEMYVKPLEQLYDSLSMTDPVTTPDSVCMAGFVNHFPLMQAAPEPLTEKSAAYKEYYEVYDNERMLSFREWYAGCSVPVQQNLSALRARINELGAGHLTGYVPVVAARFTPSTPDGLSGDLILILRSKDRRADVVWHGPWKNDFLAGDELVRALTSSEPAALSFLTVQNQTTWVPVKHGSFSRHFYKYYNLGISWNGLLIPMNGEFILPDYLLAEPAVAEWIAANAKKAGEVIAPGAEEIKIAGGGVAKIPFGTLEHKGSKIIIKPFEISTSQISQSQYKASCSEKDFGKYKGDSIPAHSVSWNEANSCCKALGGDLPTEAEWEYAARAGLSLEYAWLGNAADYAVFGGISPIKVASKKPNGWGLYDMFGNVSEWVKDDGFWFGKYKFFKGGSYSSKEEDLKVENSKEEDARYWSTQIGFRCVFR
jgi:formylglycine-generating enzyme required for sulfatase activity